MQIQIFNRLKDKYAKIFLPYLKHYKNWALWGSICLVLNVVLFIPVPLANSYLIDNILPEKNIKMLIIIGTIILFLIIVRALLSFLQNYFFTKLNERVISDIQMDIFNKIQHRSIKFIQKHKTGYLMSRILNDPEKLKSLLIETIVTGAKDIFIFLLGVSIIFFINWKLALIFSFNILGSMSINL